MYIFFLHVHMYKKTCVSTPLSSLSLPKPSNSASGMIGKSLSSLTLNCKIKPIFQNLSLKTAPECLSRSSSGPKVHWSAWFFVLILFFISTWLKIGKKSNIWIRFDNSLPIIWSKMKFSLSLSLFLSLSLSLSLSRMFISFCIWAQSRCQGRKVGLNLVYDEDLRLFVRYLRKRDLRPTKYWRKSIGVS